jgi:iron-sulfur cluster repair protein YtfE (RIC family)
MQANLPGANWSVAPLRELIRHIVLEYHDCFRLEVPQLERGLPNAGLRALQHSLDATLTQEEEKLFPAIRKCEEAADAGLDPPFRHANAVRYLIPVVTRNNDRLRALVREIIEQQSGALEVTEHIQLENEVLFPRALKLLS